MKLNKGFVFFYLKRGGLMIEPYSLDSNSNLNLMLDNLMENTFYFSIKVLTLWIFISLIIWVIRSQNKIRKSNKIWSEEFYNKCNFRNYYNSNSINYCLF